MTETRVTAEGLRRRRQCGVCKRRFTTYETYGAPAIKVTKRDGTTEAFDAKKIAAALGRVCSHRTHIKPEDLHRVAFDVEAKLVEETRKSIGWSDLVELVLVRLRNLDPVSAHRFAANYTDDTGIVRLEHDPAASTSQQLGLPLDEEDEA